MGVIRERTQKEIMDYIRIHSKDGKLTQSLLDIAEQIGYSNATIHRALKSLEEKGMIEISAPEKPTEPNTIIYKGEKNDIDELLSQGVKLSDELQNISERLQEYIHEVTIVTSKLKEQNEKAQFNQDRVINIVDVPESNMQIITLRKDGEGESQPQ